MSLGFFIFSRGEIKLIFHIHCPVTVKKIAYIKLKYDIMISNNVIMRKQGYDGES